MFYGPKGARQSPPNNLRHAEDGRRNADRADANELVTDVIIPPPAGMRRRSTKCAPRSLRLAVGDRRLATKLDGKKVTAARLVLAMSHPCPGQSGSGADARRQNHSRRELDEEVGKPRWPMAKPLSGNAYKVQLARVAAQTAICKRLDSRRRKTGCTRFPNMMNKIKTILKS